MNHTKTTYNILKYVHQLGNTLDKYMEVSGNWLKEYGNYEYEVCARNNFEDDINRGRSDKTQFFLKRPKLIFLL